MTVEKMIYTYLQQVGSASRGELQRDLQCKADSLNNALGRLVRNGYVRQCDKSEKHGDSIRPTRRMFHFSCTEKHFKASAARVPSSSAKSLALAPAVVARHAREADSVPHDLIAAFSRMVATCRRSAGAGAEFGAAHQQGAGAA
jgi:hypothetical protein